MNTNLKAVQMHPAISAIIQFSQTIKDAETLDPTGAGAVRGICEEAIPQLAELYSGDACLEDVHASISRTCDAVKSVVGRRLAELETAA